MVPGRGGGDPSWSGSHGKGKEKHSHRNRMLVDQLSFTHRKQRERWGKENRKYH